MSHRDRKATFLPYAYYQHCFANPYELSKIGENERELELSLGPFASAYLPNIFPVRGFRLLPMIEPKAHSLSIVLCGEFRFLSLASHSFRRFHLQLKATLSLNLLDGIVGGNRFSMEGIDFLPIFVSLLAYHQPFGLDAYFRTNDAELSLLQDADYRSIKEKEEGAVTRELRKHERKVTPVVGQNPSKKKKKGEDPKKDE